MTGTHPYPPGPGVALTADTKIQRMPSESAAQALAVTLPSSQTRVDANRTAPGGGEYRLPGASDRTQPAVGNAMIVETGNTKNSALMAKKPLQCPNPSGTHHGNSTGLSVGILAGFDVLLWNLETNGLLQDLLTEQ